MKQELISLFILLFLLPFSLLNGQNIIISNNTYPCEPSIMMNPEKPDILVAGSILDFVHYSIDGGKTWSSEQLSSSYGVWGDPVIDCDRYGNFYFFHLSNPDDGNWIDRIVCQKSTDNGKTWSNGTFAGLNGAKAQDKHWSAIDRSNNNIYLTWTQFDVYGSSQPNDSSNILFSKSNDAGETWTAPIRVSTIAGDCIDDDNTVEGAVPAVGPDGEIYVAWARSEAIYFNKSLDEGATWLQKEVFVSDMPGGWSFSIPGIYRANGLPVTKCDTSGGDFHGTIYVNWSDQRNGVDNTDVWLCKSTDGGNSWSEPIKVNNDETVKHQFFTWMDIDQTNGKLYLVFYDRRSYDDLKTDVYLAISDDGGNTFINRKISESPFIPDEGIFFGDYTNIVAHNNIIRPIWTRLNKGNLSIITDITPLEQIISGKQELNKHDENKVNQYPNPATDVSYISFKLRKPSVIDIEIFDQTGKKVTTIMKSEQKGYGKYIIPIYIDKLQLKSGIYYCKLLINSKEKKVRKIVVE